MAGGMALVLHTAGRPGIVFDSLRAGAAIRKLF